MSHLGVFLWMSICWISIYWLSGDDLRFPITSILAAGGSLFVHWILTKQWLKL